MVMLVKALLSGLSLTLTLGCGIGLMRTLMIPYEDVIPGGHTKAPSLTQVFMSLPHHDDSTSLGLLVLMVGGTWLGAQTHEQVLALIQRCAVAFIVTGIYACSFTHWCLCGVIHWESHKTSFIEYLWLLPASIPLLIALIKHRHARRMGGQA
jgi:hypothetical protein